MVCGVLMHLPPQLLTVRRGFMGNVSLCWYSPLIENNSHPWQFYPIRKTLEYPSHWNIYFWSETSCGALGASLLMSIWVTHLISEDKSGGYNNQSFQFGFERVYHCNIVTLGYPPILIPGNWTFFSWFLMYQCTWGFQQFSIRGYFI